MKRLTAAALGALFLIGCGDDPAQVKKAGPLRLTLVSPAVMAGAAGDTLSVMVRVTRDDDPVRMGVTASVISGGGAPTEAHRTTDASGHAEFHWVLGGLVGTHELVVRAAAGSEADSARVSAQVTAGDPSRLRWGTTPPDSARVATAWSVTLRLTDAFDNGVSDHAVTWATEAGTLSATVDTTDGEGWATVTWTLGITAGPQSLSATAGSLSVDTTLAPAAGPVAALTFAEDTLHLSGAGDSAHVSVQATDAYGNPLAADATFALTEARPWSPVRDVLDAAPLARGVVVSAGAGIATIAASASAVSAQLPVRVTPPAPVIYELSAPELAQPGDSVVLHGYDMAGRAYTVDGEEIVPTYVDSARVTLRLPQRAAEFCTGPGRSVVAPADDSDDAWDVQWQRSPSVIDLDVGGSLRMGASELDCLQLAYRPGAEYILAFLEDDRIVAAATAAEPFGAPESNPPTDTLVLEDRTLAGFPTSTAAVRAPAVSSATPSGLEIQEAPPALAVSAVAAATLPDFRAHVGPWTVGDRATLHFQRYLTMEGGLASNPAWVDEPGTVFDIIGERIVLMIPDGDAQALNRGPWQDQLAAYRDQFTAGTLPLLDAAYGAPTRGSNGTGQVVVLVGESLLTFTAYDDAGAWAQLSLLGYYGDPTADLILPLVNLDHELAHVWQLDYHSRICPADCPSTRWAVEGGALVLETMAGAARAGQQIGVPANGDRYYARTSVYGWSQNASSLVAATWVYSFPWGYSTSQLLLDDLIARAMGAGASFPVAVRAVLQGALAGWGGYSVQGADDGLTARMRNLLGADWDPTTATLMAIASVGADDRTESPDFQNPWVHEAWHWSRAPWVSAGNVTIGSGSRLVRPFDATYYGYFHLRDEWGASLRATTTRPVEWLLVRTR